MCDWVFVFLCVCVHVCMFASVYACVCVCVHACWFVCERECVHARLCVGLCLCVCVVHPNTFVHVQNSESDGGRVGQIEGSRR